MPDEYHETVVGCLDFEVHLCSCRLDPHKLKLFGAASEVASIKF